MPLVCRMENHLSGTRRQILAVLLISTLVGVLCAAVNLGVLPNRGGPSAMLIGAATTHVLVDSPERSIVKRRPLPQDQNTLVGRGEMMGRIIVSPLVLDRVARHEGQVKLHGEVWTARPLNDNDVYEPGDQVTVVQIDGATAVVWKGP